MERREIAPEGRAIAYVNALVIGGDRGNNVAAAADASPETARGNTGPSGGTCLSRGCTSSSILYSVMTIQIVSPIAALPATPPATPNTPPIPTSGTKGPKSSGEMN